MPTFDVKFSDFTKCFNNNVHEPFIRYLKENGHYHEFMCLILPRQNKSFLHYREDRNYIEALYLAYRRKMTDFVGYDYIVLEPCDVKVPLSLAFKSTRVSCLICLTMLLEMVGCANSSKQFLDDMFKRLLKPYWLYKTIISVKIFNQHFK